MFKTLLVSVLSLLFTTFLNAQEKIKVISRKVEGEIRTMYNDTLYGDIKVLGYQDYYITSIEFKEKGKKKEIYSAEDIKRFRMVVPYPDRPTFGVEEVYYESQKDPNDTYRKFFYPIDEWK